MPAWPFPDACVQHLRDYASELAQEDEHARLELELRSMDADTGDEAPTAKRNRANIMLEFHRCWRLRRTPSVVGAVLCADGSLTSDPKEMAQELSNHWQEVFAKEPSHPSEISPFLTDNMPQFPTIDWKLTEEEFTDVVLKSGISAPGPDGIPYGCWRSAPRWTLALLYTCCSSWLDGAALPIHFNWSYLALLPKTDRHDIKPKDTRPLSLGNTDAKLFALALQAKFAQGLPRFISLEQRGFMPGRTILAGIVEVESKMVSLSITSSRAAALSFDFSAAFPSLAHTFLWEALRAAGIPQHIITAIKGLYKDNKHWLKLKGGVFPSVEVRSGVKQGCPLSPTLFLIAAEPILRFLKKHLGPEDFISGYADDLAIVVAHLWKVVPALAYAFETIGKVAGLSLNIPKCILIPLWVRPPGPLRHFYELAPHWRNFRISLAAKYLGAWIGPGSIGSRWDDALDKFRDRVQSVAGMRSGSFSMTLFYRIYAVSTLMYLMQLFEAPASWALVQNPMFTRMVKGPGGWLPRSWFCWNLRSLLLPSQFVDLEVLHQAALMRAAEHTLPSVQATVSSMRENLDGDDAPLWHPWREWHQRCSAQCMVRAAARAKEICPNRQRDPNRPLQRQLSQNIRELGPSIDPWPVLDRRLSRWRKLQVDAPWPRIMRVRFTATLAAIQDAPAATKWAYIRTILNGWCTARRFQATRLCLFCNKGEDSLEHFSRCTVIRDVTIPS